MKRLLPLAFVLFALQSNSQITKLGNHVLDSIQVSSTGGFNLTVISDYAMQKSKKAALSIAIGDYSFNQSEGFYTVGLGPFSGLNNTTGSRNFFGGPWSFAYNKTGSNNTGTNAFSGYSNIDGNDNSYYAPYSGYANEHGSLNSGFAPYALQQNKGAGNSVFGHAGLLNQVFANYNSTFGTDVGVSNISGHDLTAGGTNAIVFNTTGNGISTWGVHGFYNNTTASWGTGSGFKNAFNNRTGDGVTNIGAFTNVLDTNLINASAFGFAAVVDRSYKIVLGNPDVTSIGGPVGWTSFSDGRYKRIKGTPPGLEFIDSLKPVTYTLDIKKIKKYFKPVADSAEIAPNEEAEKIVYSGFIAQQVDSAARAIGYSFSGVSKPKDTSKILGLDYSAFVVPLVKATQQLHESVNKLTKRIEELEKQTQNSTTVNAIVTTAILEQNTPNPTANKTSIHYVIPDGAKGQIAVFDAGGKQLQRLNVYGSGVLNLDISMLPAGTYGYSLFVDGRLVDTKRMAVVNR